MKFGVNASLSLYAFEQPAPEVMLPIDRNVKSAHYPPQKD